MRRNDLDETTLDLPWLPRVTHVVFERSPLVLALCQVRFAPILSIADPVFVAPFQREIQAQYPVAAKHVGVEMEIKLDEAEIRPGTPYSFQWRFSDQDDNWVVILAQNFLAIETRAYENFDDFIERLRKALLVLVEYIRPSVITRLGLRYINEIRLNGLNWTSIIRHELLGALAIEALSRDVHQAMQQMVLRYPNDLAINIRHGILPLGTTVKPRPAERTADEPFYLLDFDAFREVRSPGDLPMDPDTICETTRLFNEVIYRLFRWSITEEYASTLGVRR